jgi:hypothetical protein
MPEIYTSLTGVVNDTDVRGKALLELIKQYIQLSGFYYGFRSIGSEDIAMPCVMVEPRTKTTKMDRLGKYRIKITYFIYWFVTESNPEAIVALCDSLSETLEKLFSNNALNDLGTANSSKYKQYPNPSGGYYWLTSEMSSIRWSGTYIDAVPRGKYMRAGFMQFDVEDVVIK